MASPFPQGSSGPECLRLDLGNASDTEVVSVMLAPPVPETGSEFLAPRKSRELTIGECGTAHICLLRCPIESAREQVPSRLHGTIGYVVSALECPSVLSTGSAGTRVLEGWVPLVVETPGKS